MAIQDASDDIWDCVRDLLAGSDRAVSVSVAGLPSGKDPRSLIVVEGRVAAARLVRRQFGGGGPRRSIQAGAIAALIVTGLSAKIPTLKFDLPTELPTLGYHDWLCQALAVEARVGAVLLGPPRANRKPVVLLIDGSGALVAVAKFGVNKVTRPLVRHEALALQQIKDALGETLHVPELLASGTVGQSEAFVMAPLPDAQSGRRPSRAALIEVVRAVGAVDQQPGPSLSDIASHPRLGQLRNHIDGISQKNVGVKLGSFHGDLHPGNLSVAHDGRVMLWDWERWGRGAPMGIDLLHHDLQSWITQEGMAPKDAATALIAQAPTILEPFGVSSSTAPAIACDYLIRLGARYADDEQDRAGSPLGAIEQWLFPAVLNYEPDRET